MAMVWEDEGVLAPSLEVSSKSAGSIQASGSDPGEGGELGSGSSMKFAMRYRDRRSGSRMLVQCEMVAACTSQGVQESKALVKLAGVP